MPPVLRLYEDVLANDAELSLPASPRLIFVVHGSITKADRELHDDEAIGSESAARLKAGHEGATVWRWEFTADGAGGATTGPGFVSREKLAAPLHTLPKGPLLLRGDSVAFPPGGCAYLHRHQGPESAASLTAASASIRPATPPPTVRVAPGTRPGQSPCSLRPPTGRPASSAP